MIQLFSNERCAYPVTNDWALCHLLRVTVARVGRTMGFRVLEGKQTVLAPASSVFFVLGGTLTSDGTGFQSEIDDEC